MTHWVFISSTTRFRMNDWLEVSDYVEFIQKNKVKVNDVVYLYTTAPVCRIEFMMVVDRINVPYDELIDDSAYSLHPGSSCVDKDTLCCRLKLVKKVNTPLLHLDLLRSKGLRASMQSPFRVTGDLLDYIEKQFID